jgi:hypothetical protein
VSRSNIWHLSELAPQRERTDILRARANRGFFCMSIFGPKEGVFQQNLHSRIGRSWIGDKELEMARPSGGISRGGLVSRDGARHRAARYFRSDMDRRHWLQLGGGTSGRFDLRSHGYVLIPNHII